MDAAEVKPAATQLPFHAPCISSFHPYSFITCAMRSFLLAVAWCSSWA